MFSGKKIELRAIYECFSIFMYVGTFTITVSETVDEISKNSKEQNGCFKFLLWEKQIPGQFSGSKNKCS